MANTISVSFVPLASTALASAGNTGGISVSFEALKVRDKNYYEGVQASMISALNAAGSVQPLRTGVASMPEAVTWGAIQTGTRVAVGPASSAVAVGTPWSPTARLFAAIVSRVDVEAGIPSFTEPGEVWVVNDETGASSMYENFGFNSYAKYRGAYLAAKADGVYELGGNTDKDTPIAASVNFGQMTFGSLQNKTVTEAYVGMSTSGYVYLRVTAAGGTYMYRSTNTNASVDVQRFQLGRGLRANYFQFELLNQSGADFDISSVEFMVAVLSRRV